MLLYLLLSSVRKSNLVVFVFFRFLKTVKFIYLLAEKGNSLTKNTRVFAWEIFLHIYQSLVGIMRHVTCFDQ